MRLFVIMAVVSCAVAFCTALSFSPAFAAGIPVVTDTEVAQALELAGSNRGQLEEALWRYERDAFANAAMRFMVVSMPVADLGSVTTTRLCENFELAKSVLDLPYASHYDLETWAHYVLPMRVSQEPLEDWRAYFHSELVPEVDGVETLEEAYTKIWKVAGRCGFQQTQRRDQGPLSTLKSGYGRCEELIIVHVDALRSIGVPARLAYCPYWSHSDNNHAWVEVYLDDGQWWCDEVVGKPDRSGGWVMDACRQASVVVSTCFGLPSEKSGDVLGWKEDIGARYCTINSIGNYRGTGRVNITVPESARPGAYSYGGGGSAQAVADGMHRALVAAASDSISAGAAWEPYELTVHVFNFGAMRRVARIPLDATGTATIELGPGTYIFTTSAPVGAQSAWVELDEGEVLELDWANAERPVDDFVLHYLRDTK